MTSRPTRTTSLEENNPEPSSADSRRDSPRSSLEAWIKAHPEVPEDQAMFAWMEESNEESILRALEEGRKKWEEREKK